ncbi:MAG TPA: 3'-5' exonuclease [Ktedonobacterales bacterium]|jgi:DNA polymerase III epsilon subunit-like protein|nr:3'-5' exonuclease [Ktedonobacterales bacterium]
MDDQDEISRRIDAWIRRTAYSPRSAPTATNSGRTHIRRWAQGVLAANDRWMILDTETTGFGNTDDIIEVAAVTPRGETLIDCLIRPGRRIPYEITRLTGISNEMVAGSPRFPFAWQNILNTHLGARGVIAYNAPFDIRMLTQNIQRHCGLAWSPVRSDCLMRAYASYRGDRMASGGYRSHKLGVACAQMGITHEHAHRALGDCLVSAQLLRALAE